MRVIDKVVTGSDLSDLAAAFFDRMNPVDANTGQFAANSPAAKLRQLASNNSIKKYQPVLDEMVGNLKDLFVGTPPQLMTLHEALLKKHKGKKEDLHGKRFKKLIEPVFGFYKTFRTSQARALVHDWFSALNIFTCPYCNHEWLTQIGNHVSRDSLLLFDVDHYFPKWNYPYFALSFYNLIPACTSCNERIKLDGLLDLKDHFHPYVDDMDTALRFEVPITSASQFFRENVPVQLRLVPLPMALLADQVRAVKTSDFFRLSERYATHEDYAREVLQKSIKYDRSTLESLYSSHGKSMFQSKEQLVRMVLGNYPLAVDMHRRPLAKLAKDLAHGSPLMDFLTT